MTDDVTLIAAFGAGLLSFLSPCVLPIVPGYLSLISGVGIADLESTESGSRVAGRVVANTALFVSGFSAVFVLLGMGATSIGQALTDHQGLLTRGAGLLVLTMGLFVLGSLYLQAPWLYQEARFSPRLAWFGPFASPVAGVAFGFGWTPCIGPVLTSVLAIAAADGRASRGALLLAVYSAGLGVPFLVTGVAFARTTRALGVMKRHLRTVTWVSAVSLTFFGTVLALDRLSWVTVQLQRVARSVGLDFLVELG